MIITEINNITKKCSKCKIEKQTKDFWLRKERKSGLQSACISCKRKIEVNKNRTKEGLIKSIYNDQLKSSRRRGHPKPSYTANELILFVLNNDYFHKIYNNWALSKYSKKLRPSLDRCNDYLPYSLINIDIMTWEKNMEKGHSDRKNGINNKMNKSVYQIDKNGTVIKKHYSMMQAQRDTKVSSGKICMCCKGSRNTAGGFIWKYAP